MAKLSIREAVKHFDVSRPTLQKALKLGKISGYQNEKGRWSIDHSEMARVYKSRTLHPAKVANPSVENSPPVNTPSTGQIETLKEQLADAEKRAAIAEALAEERGRHIDDLRRMLPPPERPYRSWWPWGKKV